MVAKCLQSKDTTPISPLEAGLSLGLAFGPLGAIFELLKHMGLQSVQGKERVGTALLGGDGMKVPPSEGLRLFLETRSIPLHLTLHLRTTNGVRAGGGR